jgi:hypothetical protein
MGPPIWVEAWLLSFHMIWAIQPHSVTLLVAHAVGQKVKPSFHSVTGHLQMLAGIIVDVMYPVDQICHEVNGGSLLVRRCCKQQVVQQESSCPNTRFAGIKSIVS